MESSHWRTYSDVSYLVQQEVIQLTEDEEHGREDVKPHRPELSQHARRNPDHHHKEQKRGAIQPKVASLLTDRLNKLLTWRAKHS